MIATQNTMKEKNNRKSKRISCFVPVEGKSGSCFDDFSTVDFSKGGLGFITQHKVAVNKEIAIEIDLDANAEPAFVIGKVCWVKKMPAPEKGYRVGVIFKDVLRGSKSRLNQYFSKKK